MSQRHQEEHDGLSVSITFGTQGERLTPLLHAHTGNVFGLYDPEVWEYVSFKRKTAEYIAQGFPEYWTNRPEELLNNHTADETASKSRDAGVYLSAKDLPSIPLVFSFGSFSSSNPFEVLLRQLKEQGEAKVPLSLWHQYCESLFRQLINSRVARSPEIFFFSPVRDWTMHRIQSRDDSRSFAYHAEFDVYSQFNYCPRTCSHLVRVVHRHGHVYRLYQPETWQYVSLSRQTAEDICGGFPEYWDERPDEELEPSDTAATASLAHRRRVISRLAQQPIPLPKLYRLRESSLWRLPVAMRAEIAAIRTSNPFLLIEQELNHSTSPESPTSEIWRHWATDLYEHLLTCKQVVKQPLFVGVPEWEMQPWEDDEEQTEPTLVEQSQPTDATPPVPDDVSHQRGPTLISQQNLESLRRRSADRPVQWGPLFYEESAAYHSHFCVTGMPRSGKTTLLRLLFESLHTNVTPPPRFVFYDAKANLLPYMFPPGSLTGEGLNERASDALFILSPYDERGTAWDIASDCSNQAAASEIAEILFPEPDRQKKDEFFSPAARDVAVEVMSALTRQAGTNWTLYDLLCSLQLENIEAVMSSNPGGTQRYKIYFGGSGRSTDDLIKTLRTKTARLLPSAAAWRFAKQRLGLRQWTQSHTKSIVLLRVQKPAKACNEINRILLNILAQELLANENPKARTFLYLDEFEHLERIDQMINLAHDGVSQQVNMALAFHDLGTLKEVYGGATEGILGDAMFRAFLRVNTRSTSDWASDQIGSPEVKVKQKNTQRGSTKHEGAREADPDRESSQTGEVESEQYAIRRLVLPDEVRDLPMPHEAKSVTGYFVAPGHGPYRGTLPASKLFRSAADFLNAQHSEENFYAMWPKVEGVSERCPQPGERYDVPDDTFFTLHQLGFVKPGYAPAAPPIPPPAIPPSTPEPPPPVEQSRSIQPPPDAAPADNEKRTPPPPAERNYDLDIELDLGD